jgi:hypothetical protein
MNFDDNGTTRRKRRQRRNLTSRAAGKDIDDFGQQIRSNGVVNERALRQATLLEAQWEADAAKLAKQELRQQAKELLESLTMTVKNLERQLLVPEQDTSKPLVHPDVTELSPPRHRHPARLTPLKRTTINLDDLEALSELAPGTSLAELLTGLKQTESSSFRSASNPNFGALAQISEEQQRYNEDNDIGYDDEEEEEEERQQQRQQEQERERGSWNDSGGDIYGTPGTHDARGAHAVHVRRRSARSNNSNTTTSGRRRREKPRGGHKQRRPQSAGSRRRKRGRSRRRPKSAGKRRSKMSTRLSPPPLVPNFVEPLEKSMKYQLALSTMKALDIPEETDGDQDHEGGMGMGIDIEMRQEENLTKTHTRRRLRPRSAPMGGRGRRKKRTMSDVEAEVARKEIDSLSHAPPTHDEKVKKLHRYNWNQEQTKLTMATWLPPLNPDGTLGRTRPATAGRINHLSQPRLYRQNRKYQFPSNPPFKTNGGQGLLGKIGYVTGLGNTPASTNTGGAQHTTGMTDGGNQPHFQPNRRFLKMVTRGGNTLGQRIANYKLEHCPEYSELSEGQTVISINYCNGCHKHQKTTRHTEEKFQSCALQVEAALLEEMPDTRVIKRKVGNRLIGALEIQMCRRVRNRLEKKLLHSRIIMGTWPKPSAIVNLARQFMPEHSLTVCVTTSSSNGDSPLLAAKHVDKIISGFTKLTVTLVPEKNELDIPIPAEKLTSDLVTDGFEPIVHRKSIPAPSMPTAANSHSPNRHSPNRTTQRITTTVSSATTLIVPPGCYTLVVDSDDSLFIPIREFIDLTEQTQLDVNRTICRQRQLLVRFVKVAAAKMQAIARPLCIARDVRTGAKLEGIIIKNGSYVVLKPLENSFMENIEIALVDRVNGTDVIKGVQMFDVSTGLRKIEESYLNVNHLHSLS